MLYLLLAIIAEVAGTVSVKLSEGFTKPIASVLGFVFYGLSLTTLTFALKSIDLSVAYAVWGGLGMVGIATIGILCFKEPTTALKMGSIAVIMVGVVGLNLGIRH